MSGWAISFVITAIVAACAPLKRLSYRDDESDQPSAIGVKRTMAVLVHRTRAVVARWSSRRLGRTGERTDE